MTHPVTAAHRRFQDVEEQVRPLECFELHGETYRGNAADVVNKFLKTEMEPKDLIYFVRRHYERVR